MRQTIARHRPRFAVMILVMVFGASVSCGSGGPRSLSSMPDATSAHGAPASPTAPRALEQLSARRLSPVYWLGENDATVYLYREFVKLPDAGDPIASALERMLAGKPKDPDYFSLWRPATALGASIDEKNVITLDISRDAFAATIDAGLAKRSIAQLVFTATAAAANAGILTGTAAPRVRVLVDGEAGFKAFGKLELPDLLARDYSLRAPLWVIDPQEGAVQVAGRVLVNGDDAAFSGGTHWQIQDLGDKARPVVSGGEVPGGKPGQGDDAFSFEQPIEPLRTGQAPPGTAKGTGGAYASGPGQVSRGRGPRAGSAGVAREPVPPGPPWRNAARGCPPAPRAHPR